MVFDSGLLLADSFGGVVIGIVVVLFVLALVGVGKATQKTCAVCSSVINGKVNNWQIDGKKVTVCTACSRRLRSHVSKNAVDKLVKSKKKG